MKFIHEICSSSYLKGKELEYDRKVTFFCLLSCIVFLALLNLIWVLILLFGMIFRVSLSSHVPEGDYSDTFFSCCSSIFSLHSPTLLDLIFPSHPLSWFPFILSPPLFFLIFFIPLSFLHLSLLHLFSFSALHFFLLLPPSPSASSTSPLFL